MLLSRARRLQYEFTGRRELNGLMQRAIQRAIHRIHPVHALDFVL